jgi:hypothetical protein
MLGKKKLARRRCQTGSVAGSSALFWTPLPSSRPCGRKFKAVNARDKNFTKAKLKKRMNQVEASIERYMAALEACPGRLRRAKEVGASLSRFRLSSMAKPMSPITRQAVVITLARHSHRDTP